MVSAILLAAGSGSRMKCKENKIFLSIGAYSVLQRSLMTMDQVECIDEIRILVAPGEEERVASQVTALGLRTPWQIILGGKTRQASVYNGLATLSDNCQYVFIHDCARPLATKAIYEKVLEGAKTMGAAIPVVPVKDTIKVVQRELVEETLDRSLLYAAQTPQCFEVALLCKAHERAQAEGIEGTDDASLVEYLGQAVVTVAGDYKNCKVTTRDDLSLVKAYLGVEPMRIGYGYDIHRFKEGRPCILGGVLIESPFGPDGHSDADVLLHALMDALLGAAGLRDIGYYFPPTDPAYEGASSLAFLKKVVQLLGEKGYIAHNVDLMVIAEAPKINPHVERMKEHICEVLQLDKTAVSIKATTNEGLGPIGRKEGIAAQAVVTIIEIDR